MRYKNLEVVPFWTITEKKFAINELNRLSAEVEYLKEQLQEELNYSKNAINCNQLLQLKNLSLVKELEKLQQQIFDTKPKETFYQKFFK